MSQQSNSAHDRDSSRSRIRSTSPQRRLTSPKLHMLEQHRKFAASPQRVSTINASLSGPTPALGRPDSSGVPSSFSITSDGPPRREHWRGPSPFSPVRRSGSPERRRKIIEIENAKKRKLQEAPLVSDKKPKSVVFNNEVQFNDNDITTLNEQSHENQKNTLKSNNISPTKSRRLQTTVGQNGQAQSTFQKEVLARLAQLEADESLRSSQQTRILSELENLQDTIFSLHQRLDALDKKSDVH